jgi:hypothetical protein
MKNLLHLCAPCLLCGQIPAALIEAEGRAPGDMKTALKHPDFLTPDSTATRTCPKP